MAGINLNPGIQTKHVKTNHQIADILTKGSPHLHTNSYLSILFSSVQKDDRMSQRHAELVTESARVKLRPVRDLFSIR